MKQEIINGGNARYLGELERFKDGIPFWNRKQDKDRCRWYLCGCKLQ